MLRLACALLVTLVPLTAAAEEPASCTTPPHDTRLRAYQLELAKDPEMGTAVFAIKGDAEFPAISEDGSTLAQLFFDGEDFTGFPITTLVLWNKSGKRIAAFSVGGASGPPTAKPLRDANARLAATRWRPLATFRACGGEDSEVSTIRFDAKLALSFNADTNQLMRGKRVLAVPFPSPGRQMSDMTGQSGGCGGYRAIDYGFGGRALGFVVIVAHASLGGDSCFGLPSAELATVVPVR